MSIDAIGSKDTPSKTNCTDENDHSASCWNGRVVNIEQHPKPKIVLCSRGTISGAIHDYFDNEKKKQNEFDVAIYQYHVRCNSEESKKHLEQAFENMALGSLGVVIGVARFIANPVQAPLAIYWCSKRIWMGIEDFKKAMEASKINLDEVRFVTWSEDLNRNTKELINNSILEPWKPLEVPNYHYNDNPHYTKPLDSWKYV